MATKYQKMRMRCILDVAERCGKAGWKRTAAGNYMSPGGAMKIKFGKRMIRKEVRIGGGAHWALKQSYAYEENVSLP